MVGNMVAQTQNGGYVKEQVVGALFKMAAVRNVIILKTNWRYVFMATPGPRWRL
jgi:hypothetical protein